MKVSVLAVSALMLAATGCAAEVEPTPPSASTGPSPSIVLATPSPPSAGFVEMAELDDDVESVVDGAHADGTYVVAVRSRIRDEQLDTAGTQDRLWLSTDGREWVRAHLAAQYAEMRITSIVPGRDAGFLLYGTRYDADPAGDPVVLRSAAGSSWEEVESNLPSNVFLQEVEHHEDRGYALLAPNPEEPNASVWFSSDGLDWELAHQIGERGEWIELHDFDAGAAGFMAVGVRMPIDFRMPIDDRAQWVLFTAVSADGLDWDEAALPVADGVPLEPPMAAVSSHGSGWLSALRSGDGGTVRFWRSSDGLTWEPAGEIDGLDASDVWAPILLDVEGTAYLSHRTTADYVFPTMPLWRSTDGVEWTVASATPSRVAIAMPGEEGAVLAGTAGVTAVVWIDR